MAAPRSIKPQFKFRGEIYVLSKEEGGRHTPFFSGYSPQFFFRTTDVTGQANLVAGTEMAMPGDNVSLIVELGKPVGYRGGESLRHSRRRQDGRVGDRHGDFGLKRFAGGASAASDFAQVRQRQSGSA